MCETVLSYYTTKLHGTDEPVGLIQEAYNRKIQEILAAQAVSGAARCQLIKMEP